MSIFKDFYKREQPHKIFYAKDMKVRSQAYGEKVNQEFLDWQTYVFEKRKTNDKRFVLSELDNLYGYELQDQAAHEMDKGLAPLAMDGTRFELRMDGHISINGKRSALCVGTEIKAGSLFHIPGPRETISGLAVIGKPNGLDEMKLSVYFFGRGDFETQAFDSISLDPTLDASSHLFCLGRHVFLIHNSVLDYYYLNVEERRLERVAIGEDGNNEEFSWCKFVSPCFVTNGKGDVFWISDQDVYTFPIGYPRKLVSIKSNKIEKPIHLCGTEDGVVVYRAKRGTDTVVSAKYKKAESGRYLAQMNNVDD